MMFDYVPQDIAPVPDSIVYVINDEVQKIVPLQNAPKSERGFNFPVKDADGNITLEYRETAFVRTVYFDKDGNVVPLEKASSIMLRYIDKKGNILSRPLQIIKRE
jgi:hypothetical protein